MASNIDILLQGFSQIKLVTKYKFASTKMRNALFLSKFQVSKRTSHTQNNDDRAETCNARFHWLVARKHLRNVERVR
jgi:hypothetical protein